MSPGREMGDCRKRRLNADEEMVDRVPVSSARTSGSGEKAGIGETVIAAGELRGQMSVQISQPKNRP